MMLRTRFQDSMPCGFKQEYFSCFAYISKCKTFDPRGGAIYGPIVVFFTNLMRVYLVLLQANIKALALVVLDKIIFTFPLKKPM